MEVISFILLILLSFYGYSVGVVIISTEAKPQIYDLVIILCLWAVVVYLGLTMGYNRWLFIIAVMLTSFAIGVVLALHRKQIGERAKDVTKWQRWVYISKQVGGFQGRAILSLFFFTFVAPFALAVRIFLDPLGIEDKGCSSYWLPRAQVKDDPNALGGQD